MSIATQIERLQGVRDQIRTKMVGLGLSENTDLLQNLADDLDSVNKISPTNNGTTDPGTGYTNVDTLDRSTSTRYIKVPKGYNDTDRKFTVSGVANGAYSASVASHTTSNATASSNVSGSIVNVTSATKPSGTDGSDYFTITPTLTTKAGSSKATGKATIDTAGYLAAGNKSSSESSKSVGVTATQGDNYYLKASSVTKENPGVDPGNRYGNRATVDPSMVDQYVKITGGYLSDSKITIKKMTEGSVSSATTTDPGTENQTTVTPSLDKQYVKISAGHLPHSKITVEAIPNQKKSSDVSAEVSASISNVTSIDASQVTSGVTVTASASGNMTVPLGYYSSAVTSTPTDSASTTIKPTLAGTNSDGAVSITASTTDIVKTSASDYSNGFITKVTVSPTPSEEQTATPSNTTQTVTPKAGKLLSKVTVNAIPSPYFNTSGVTATAGTVLKDYKFVNSSGTTVTGTIATASSGDVSGSVSGSNPSKITLTTEKTSGSSSTTATASATVAKGLYTGSSNIEKSLTSKTITATAEATLASSVTGSTTVPSTLPSGTVTITPSIDNVKRIYSDSRNKGFITNVVLEAMPTGSYSASVASHTTSNATAGSSVTGSITGVATTTKPSGTDGTDYYTITPKLTTGAGSSKATGKATIDTAGYLAAGNKSSSESSKSVGVTASQGSDYYLKAGSYSASVSSHTTTNATASSNVSGSIVNVTSATKPTTGTDGADYFTITPKLTTAAGSSKATGKATIGTSGYLAAGNTTSGESSKSVGVTASQGDSYYLKAGAYSASVSSHTTSNATASSSVTGSVTNIATTTKPAGTDGTDYYTITPKLTTGSGSSKATGKATVDTAGYLATGNTTSTESSKSVGVTASPGDSYYLKASSVTKEDPGTGYANKATVTPSTSAQYVKVTAGYLPNSKITVEAIPNQKGKDDVTATVTASISNITSINASQVTDGVTVTASASGSTVVPVGYYSTQVSKTPSNSKSTTIKPKLAGTNGAIELTAGTSAFTKTSTANYSNGFITSVKVNPTPSSAKEFTPTIAGGTVRPDAGKLLSSVTVKGVPSFKLTLSSGKWQSDSNVTIGKYYYNVSDANITASNNIYVMPESASTSQSFGVYAYSQSKASGASTGTLQFRAIEKPTSDLTYILHILNS